MLQEPLNDRFATVEDIFVKFVVPKLQQEYNDLFYLYTEQRNMCPNVEQIKNGFEIYYIPRHVHNSLYNGLAKIEESIATHVKDFYKLEDDVVVSGDTTFKFLNSKSNITRNTDLKFSVIDCFRYINSNYVAEEPAFEKYKNAINNPEYMTSRSSTASDNPNIVNIAFNHLSTNTIFNTKSSTNFITNEAISNNRNAMTEIQVTDPGKIEATIDNINSFTVQEMAAIYKEAVFKYNLDAVYKTYNFKGYTVVDNSGPHTPQSLVRLCDIVEVGRFGVYATDNTKNVAYRYDEYIITSMTSATARATNTIAAPYKFEVDSVYLPTGESLGWQLLSIQITDSGKDGMGQTTMIVDEAAAIYQKYLLQNTTFLNPDVLTTGSRTAAFIPEGISTASEDGGDGDVIPKVRVSASGVNLTESNYNSTTGLYTFTGQTFSSVNEDMIQKQTDYNITEVINPDGTKGYLYTPPSDVANFEDDTYQSNAQNRLITPQETLSSTTAANRVTISESYNLDAVMDSSVSSFTLGSVRQAGTVTYNTGALKDLNELKYANLDQVLYSMGAGIVPWVGEQILPVYIPANTTIDNTLYNCYTPTFTNKNKAVGKRSALFTLRQNESMQTAQIQITQYGPELVLKYVIESPFVFQHLNGVIYYNKYSYMFDYTDPQSSVGCAKGTAKVDVFFQTVPGFNTSDVNIASNFLILEKTVNHYCPDYNMGVIKNEVTIRIAYNAYAETLPEALRYLTIRLYPRIMKNVWWTVPDRTMVMVDNNVIDITNIKITGTYTYDGATVWRNIPITPSITNGNNGLNYNTHALTIKSGNVETTDTGETIKNFTYTTTPELAAWIKNQSYDLCYTIHAWGQNNISITTILAFDEDTEFTDARANNIKNISGDYMAYYKNRPDGK